MHPLSLGNATDHVYTSFIVVYIDFVRLLCEINTKFVENTRKKRFRIDFILIYKTSISDQSPKLSSRKIDVARDVTGLILPGDQEDFFSRSGLRCKSAFKLL